MRKAAVVFISTVGVMLVVGVLITHSLVILQRVAAVEAVQGMVWLRHQGRGDYAPLADRARVGAGDVLKTSANGRVDLHWIDDTRMRIGPNTVVTVLKSHLNSATHAETQVFKLDLGRVWIRILKVLSQKSKFEIVTPTATAGVRGTIFSVEVAPDGQTMVSVKEGKVAVHHGAAAAEEIPGGQMAGGGAVAGLSPEEATLWARNADVTGPYLVLKQPAPGLKVGQGISVEISGVAEPGAVVTVNGRPQTLQLERRFATAVTTPHQPGRFSITCEAKDRRGLTSRRVVSVEVTR